jgi:hypothetical protein
MLNMLARICASTAARKSWCKSDGPAFAAEAADVVGLYIDPAATAIVLCIDGEPLTRRWGGRKAI